LDAKGDNESNSKAEKQMLFIFVFVVFFVVFFNYYL